MKKYFKRLKSFPSNTFFLIWLLMTACALLHDAFPILYYDGSAVEYSFVSILLFIAVIMGVVIENKNTCETGGNNNGNNKN